LTTQFKTKKPWLSELDRGKGLAILLVVIGHVVAREPPQGAGWYLMLKFTVYLFHMPFFVFLSAVAMAYTYKNVVSFQGYLTYIKNKFYRFIPIFMAFGLLILIGKMLAGKFIHIDNASSDFTADLRNLFLYPGRSPASTLWYIYVLFMYYLIYPLFACIKSHTQVILVLIGSLFLGFYSYKVTNLFLFDRFSTYLLFAVTGWLVGKNYESFINYINQIGWLAVVLFFAVVIIIDKVFFRCIVQGDCTYFPAFFKTVHAIILSGLLSIPALMFMLKFTRLSKSNWLEKIGKYVFIIYLLNTIVIGSVKGIGLKFISWDNQNFYFYFPLLLLSGIFLPILLKKHVIKRFPRLDKATW
jgi:fucose 4-O-acetylase-like acetyltransferase